MFNQCCDMVHRIGPVYRFNSRKSSLYTDHRFSLCRSSRSHMEKNRRGIYCVVKRNGFGVEVGKGENRCALLKRKRLWIGELKLDSTASNTIRRFDTVFQRPYRYFSIALKVFFFLVRSLYKFSPVNGYGSKFVKM